MYDYKYEYQKAFDDAISQGMDEESAYIYADDALADNAAALINAAVLEAEARGL